jgi:hypothetical protein
MSISNAALDVVSLAIGSERLSDRGEIAQGSRDQARAHHRARNLLVVVVIELNTEHLEQTLGGHVVATQRARA